MLERVLVLSEFQNSNSLTKNNGGFTLVAVLMVLVVLSILGLGIAATSANIMKMSAGERDDQSAFYIAEGGAEKVLGDIKIEINRISPNATSVDSFFNDLKSFIKNIEPVETFTEIQGKKPIAKVTVEEINKGNPRKYLIVSRREIRGKWKNWEP